MISPTRMSLALRRSTICLLVRPFGNGHRVDDALALDHESMISRHAGMGRDQIFAGLEVVLLLVEPDAGDEQPLARNRSLALQQLGDFAETGAALDRRPCAPDRATLAARTAACRKQPAAEHDAGDDDHGQDEIHEDDERMADCSRSLRWRRNRFRLKRLRRTLGRRRGWPRPAGPRERRNRCRIDPL